MLVICGAGLLFCFNWYRFGFLFFWGFLFWFRFRFLKCVHNDQEISFLNPKSTNIITITNRLTLIYNFLTLNSYSSILLYFSLNFSNLMINVQVTLDSGCISIWNTSPLSVLNVSFIDFFFFVIFLEIYQILFKLIFGDYMYMFSPVY